MGYNSNYTGDEVVGLLRKVEEMSDGNLVFSDVPASEWVEDSTHEGYKYKCALQLKGVAADDFAVVLFSDAQSLSFSYSPFCETGAGTVSIWADSNGRITIPKIIIRKV